MKPATVTPHIPSLMNAKGITMNNLFLTAIYSLILMGIWGGNTPLAAQTLDRQYQNLSTEEKLNRLTNQLKSKIGSTREFAVALQEQDKISVDPLLLNLKWKAIEKHIKPHLKAAFNIDDQARFVFQPYGRYQCNNALYQITALRALNQPSETLLLPKELEPHTSFPIPQLRDRFFSTRNDGEILFQNIATELRDFKIDEHLSIDYAAAKDREYTNLATSWRHFPGQEPYRNAYQFRVQYFLKVNSEGTIVTDTAVFKILKNNPHLLLSSYIQFRNGNMVLGNPIGPVNVFPVGFIPGSSLDIRPIALATKKIPTANVIAAPEDYATSSDLITSHAYLSSSFEVNQIVRSAQQQLVDKISE